MIDFWLCAGLLLLLALAFLLIPLLRARRVQPEEDRTALNVALYQERLAEMQSQRDAGVLSAEQFESGRDEAARELLADTEGAGPARVSRIGRAAPLVLAVLLPLLGFALYLHWGASDQLKLARELQAPPRSLEDMVRSLEQAVQTQPDSAEGWYFLGRAYMAQERAAEAAGAFEQAIKRAGREPALLGLWAQAQYFANEKHWTAQLQLLADEALKADPQEVTTLGLLGIAAFERSDYSAAIQYWERLNAALPAQDPTRAAIQSGIQAARERGGAEAAQSADSPAVAEAVTLHVKVALDPALQARVEAGDSVFIFARAVSGPPMPLAVKRLTVADLPVEVTLTDADAMLPQLKLSRHPQVQLVARVSRAGDATAGEWRGSSEPLANTLKTVQSLIINQPDQP